MDWGQVHERNKAQRRQAGARTQSGGGPEDDDLAGGVIRERRGDLFIITDPNDSFETNFPRALEVGDQTKKTLDLVRAFRIFRKFFLDECNFDVVDRYDLISFYIDTNSGLPPIGNASTIIYNDIAGIGLPPIDKRAPWGGSTRLLHIAFHCQFTLRSLLHEIGHLWCAYVNYRVAENGARQPLLHEDFPEAQLQYKWLHWGRWLSNGLSCMHYDRGTWQRQADGTFLRFDHATDEFLGLGRDGFGYSPLDLYLMGLVSADASAVPEMTIVCNPCQAGNGNPNAFVAPGAITIGIPNVVLAAGPRNPDHRNSQRLFQQATIVITKGGDGAPKFIADCDSWRRNHEINFRRATGGRAILDTSLLLSGYDEIYIRHAEDDVGGSAGPGKRYWESPDLWVRNNDDGQSEPQAPLRDRPNFIYARIRNSGPNTYRSVIVQFYLFDVENEAAARENFLYPSAGGQFIGRQVIESLPPTDGTSQAAMVKQPWILDPVAYKHPFLLCEILPRDPAPLKLHHLWENKKLAQREVVIGAM